MPANKIIYLSYADNDRQVASDLERILQTLLEGQIFFRYFDLRAGASILDVMDDAISDSKWFILLLSSMSMDSPWIQREYQLATFRKLESINFNIIVVNIDGVAIPRDLRIALESEYLVNLYDAIDREGELINIAQYIERHNFTGKKKQIFVDRGEQADRFSFATRYHRVIFVSGMPGIGKTAFVINKVSQQLDKRPLTISLTQGKGNSIDYVARQILKESYVTQPMDRNIQGETDLIMLAADAITKRERHFFLFIDNLEYALGASNEISPSLVDFLKELLSRDVKTHIVFATTRSVQYPIEIATQCDILRLDELEDQYIEQCIDEWLADYPRHDDFMQSNQLANLIKLADGHPFAAQMIVGSLKAGITPKAWLQSSEPKFLRLRLAAKILGSLGYEKLTDLQMLILQILGLVNEPLSIDDMCKLNFLKQYKTEEVNDAIIALNSYLLIKVDESGFVTLHSFLSSYYREQLSQPKFSDRREMLVSDIAYFSYEQTLRLHDQLTSTLHTNDISDNFALARLTGEIFTYAITASKFLRISGREDLADKLPIDIKDTIRELVLYFYQEVRDYTQALGYADRWLQIRPNDPEIMLYKARCHRNLGGARNLEEAEKMLSKIEDKAKTRFFIDRIANERGKIASQKGDEALAETIFSRSVESRCDFPETYINLARIYLREARAVTGSDITRKHALAQKAVTLLEDAHKASRSATSLFEQFWFDIYIEALDMLEDQLAFPLLKEALEDAPDDPRLNFRMAEILREHGDLSDSEKYAQKASNNGSISASITLAYLYYAHARRHDEQKTIYLSQKKYKETSKEEDEIRAKLQESEKHCRQYKSQSPIHQHPVADVMLSKIYRMRGDWDSAEKIMKEYETTGSPYIICEQCEILLTKAQQRANSGDREGSRVIIEQVLSKLSSVSSIAEEQCQELRQRAIWLRDKNDL
ncbi:MAG: TIR domain-containing protein [Chloroflexi bacterium]|nr:TIR domain-containing protein [Chloroflexota bacterium]